MIICHYQAYSSTANTDDNSFKYFLPLRTNQNSFKADGKGRQNSEWVEGIAISRLWGDCKTRKVFQIKKSCT